MNIGAFKVLAKICGFGSGGTAAAFKGWNVTNGTPGANVGQLNESAIDPATGLAWVKTQAATPPNPNGFFGMNTHLNSGWAPYAAMTPAGYQAYAADAGIQLWRTDMVSADQLTAKAAIINGWIANGQTPQIVITPASYNLTTATYAQNYSAGFTLGAAMATAAMQSITDPTKLLWECTNELDYKCRVDQINGAGTKNPIDGANVDGSVRSDFDHDAIERLRGLVGGMVDGIHSVIPSAQCSMATGNPYAYVVFEMLLKGLETTATYAWNYTGTVTPTKPPIAFGYTPLHWYKTMNDAEAAGPSFHGSGSTCPDKYASATSYPNVLSLLQSRCNNMPLIVSEWGIQDTEANQAAYITSQMAIWYGKRSTYNIKAIAFYTLFTDTADSGTGADLGGVNVNSFGLVKYDGTTKKAGYASLKAYNTANTVAGTSGWLTIPFRLLKMLNPANWDLVDGFNAQSLRVWGAVDPTFSNGWYGTMYFGTDGKGGGDGKLRIGCNKIGGSSAVLTRMVINGVDLVEFGVGGMLPIIANYNLGYYSAGQRYRQVYTVCGVNSQSQIKTGNYTLANSSEPLWTIANSASAIAFTMHTTPEADEERCFYNAGAGPLTVNYTGRTGALSPTVAQGSVLKLKFNATLNYWFPI